nr:MAG TPA: Photosystem Q(B) protein [Bacteriophage sp.]
METNHMKRYMIQDILEMIGEVLLWAIGILTALLIIVLLGILIYGLLFDPSMFVHHVVVTVH